MKRFLRRKAVIMGGVCTKPRQTPIMGNGRDLSARKSPFESQPIAHSETRARRLIHSFPVVPTEAERSEA
jgi:hypothetical protein